MLQWFFLFLAVLFTLYVLMELWSGVTDYRYRRGFMESEDITVERRRQPWSYWYRMALRVLAAVALWMVWYASRI